MGTRVEHIARIAVQDWRTSRVRMRSATTGDPALRVVYFEILMALYEAGGELPSDPEVLADILLMPVDDIARCLKTLVIIGKTSRGGVVIHDGVLTNQRVTDDLKEEHLFREQQRAHGQKGGRPKKATLSAEKATLSKPKGSEKATLSPPLPSPLPLPSPMVTPVVSPLSSQDPTNTYTNLSRAREAATLPPDRCVVLAASPGNGTYRPNAKAELEAERADEAAMAAFGEALQAAWSAGHLNPVDFQRALIEVWRTGEIRADGTEPRPGVKSRTCSQILADMPRWKLYHDSGARPKHLETYLTKRCFMAAIPDPLPQRSASAPPARSPQPFVEEYQPVPIPMGPGKLACKGRDGCVYLESAWPAKWGPWPLTRDRWKPEWGDYPVTDSSARATPENIALNFEKELEMLQ